MAARKTDISNRQQRVRIKTACSPELAGLLGALNQFPPVSEMDDVGAPTRPIRPSALFRSINIDKKEEDAKFEKREQKYQEDLFAAAGKMLDGLKSKGYELASLLLARPNHWSEVASLGTKWIASNDEAWAFVDLAEESGVRVTEQEVMARFETVRIDRSAFCKRQGQLGRQWIDQYYKVRAIKRLLDELTHVSDNFQTADRTHIVGLFDLRDLIPKLRIDENGILHREEDPILDLLLGIDIRRIRKCRICENYFWAQRSDRRCCKRECADIFNQRLSRERKRENGRLYRLAAKKREVN
jgi:hypothetical protein